MELLHIHVCNITGAQYGCNFCIIIIIIFKLSHPKIEIEYESVPAYYKRLFVDVI